MCFLGCIAGILLGGAWPVEAWTTPSLASPAAVNVKAPSRDVAEPIAESGSLPRVRPTLVLPIVIEPQVSLELVTEPHVMPPCCRAKTDRQVSETVDVGPPRLKSMQASAEEPVAEELKRIAAVASQHLSEGYELVEDVHGPPCCQTKRRKDPVEVEPPRLKSLSAAAEETIPAERKLIAAVASQALPRANVEELEVPEPPWHQAEPRQNPAQVEPTRWKIVEPWAVALGTVIAVLTAGSFLHTFQRRTLRHELDLQAQGFSSWGETTVPVDEPSSARAPTAAVLKAPISRELEDA